MRRPGFLAAFFALYTFTFATYLYAEFLTNPAGVPLFTILSGQLPTSAIHRWGKDTPLTAITALLFVLTPIAYLAYLANRHRPMRWLLLAASLLFPIFGVLKLSRSDVFVAGIGIVAVALCHRRWAGTSRASRRSFLLKAALLVLAVSSLATR